jgi:hypothetical protein
MMKTNYIRPLFARTLLATALARGKTHLSLCPHTGLTFQLETL